MNDLVRSLYVFTHQSLLVSTSGPPSRGPHVDDFGTLLERTSYAGLSVPFGASWRAKELLLQDIVANAQTLLGKYGQENLPDPAILFGLGNQFRYGSNFYALQKTYEGAFKVDVFFDVQDSLAAGRLDCRSSASLHSCEPF